MAAPAKTNSMKRKTRGVPANDSGADDLEDMEIDMTCDEVRDRINQILDKGIMRKPDFYKAIGCSGTVVQRFLSKSGPDAGKNSACYRPAWKWFKLKAPDAGKRQKTKAATDAASTPTSSSDSSSRSSSPEILDILNIDDVHLPGEETEEVPVYDTCDEIRRKIAAHLRTTGDSKAKFCRDIYAQLPHPTVKPFQTRQLGDFLRKQGANAGCTSKIFYAAYVFFEKKRIAERQPKSEHRLNMERIWASKGGFDLVHDDRCAVWLGPGESFYINEYGELQIFRR
ncbi:hypothetical protein F5B19DRAFT_206391 [Rostrohypoxylon terebratum]|nr:hypothetical protein F5B19DRAFT_206391 [Rostrohypoxylon terebratum]